MEVKDIQLIFNEPRLLMNPIGRFFARLASYCSYAILIAAAATFLISDIGRLRWLGALLSLFLIDRLLHLRQAEKSLIDLKRFNSRSPTVNAAYYLSPATLNILERALDRTLLVGGDIYVYSLKLLIDRPEIQEGISRLDVSLPEFLRKIEEIFKQSQTQKNFKPDLLAKIEKAVKLAFVQAFNAQNRDIAPVDLFSAISFAGDERIGRLLNLFSIEPGDLEKAAIFSRFKRRFRWLKRLPATLGGFVHRPFMVRHRVMNRAWTARPTPVLDRYSVDFTDLVRKEQVGFLIGHKEEFERLLDVLSRSAKPNALLIGEPGSGKETMVAALAFRIVKDEVPAALFDKRVVSLQIGNLISGAPAEELTARLNKIVEEIILAGNIILDIPDIHNLAKTSGEGRISAADILSPIITNDAFPVIGATYPKEFKQTIEPQTDFAHAFEIIRVEEISEDEATKLLTYNSLILERQYKIIISFGAVKKAVELARRYFRQKLLPSSAEDLLKEALADISQKGNKALKPDDVIAVAEKKTNVPIHKAGKEEAERLLNLENIIHERLIDQDEAVKAVSSALREYRSGLSRRGGPIAAFLFVGPTGVGKTELSKILSRLQFGSEGLMVRFDMSEYQDKQSIFRFIGSPDGRIAGALTEAIIQKPYSLILLDEFEKAHSDILNLFLQVFDDGRLTDSLGRTVDFQNTIIISTSNAHSDFIKSQIEAGEPIEKIGEELKKKLTDYFKPELLNRFSSVIVFKNLSRGDIQAIARLQLKDLARTIEEAQGVGLTFDEAVVEKIAELGYDPIFGARPLRGVISEKLRGVLAEKILKGEIVKGGNIKAILENGEIKFV